MRNLFERRFAKQTKAEYKSYEQPIFQEKIFMTAVVTEARAEGAEQSMIAQAEMRKV